MLGNKLGHLEHADLALAAEYSFQLVIGVNHGLLGFVLQSVLLDILPEFLRDLSTRHCLIADDFAEFGAGGHWFHKSRIWLTLCFYFFNNFLRSGFLSYYFFLCDFWALLIHSYYYFSLCDLYFFCVLAEVFLQH